MIELINSGVVFNEEDHSYTLNGKRLDGITGLIKAVKFPGKYKDIPQAILEQASLEGSKIHKSCEFADKLGVIENQEAQAYLNMQRSVLCHSVANEYTVTDGEHWASNIDCIWASDDEHIYLVDIKTTYELDKEYLSWQLSVYAYMFELQNPHMKVSGLLGVHLFKEGKSNKYGHRGLYEIERKSDEDVKELLSHTDYRDMAPMPPVEIDNGVSLPGEMLQKVIDFERELKRIKEQEETLKEGIKKLMEEAGVKSFKANGITISLVPATTREQFDSTKFKKDHADMYDKYKKTSNVSSSIKIKVE